MSTVNVAPPRLPVAPIEYNKLYFDQMVQILSIFFQSLTNNGPLQGTTLNLSTIDQVTGQQILAIPTQAALASLRKGDVYYDTTAGNVLKIKT